MKPLLAIIAVLSLGIVSCDESNKGALLPGSTGNQGEIIVVAPPSIWNSDLGNVLRDGLSELMPGLPAAEPMFDITEVEEDGFSDIFKTNRNIILITVDPSKETAVRMQRDVYARDQLFVQVNLQKAEDISGVVDAHMKQLLWYFHRTEVDRLIARNKTFGSDVLDKKIKEQCGLDIVMQEDFEIAREGDHFIWLRLERSKPIGGYQHQISQGIMIYSRPYTDTLDFSDSSITAWKNEVNKTYIEGPQGSYMTISYKLYPPEISYVKFHDETAKEMRGLWRMEGYFMGGPFYALAFYNPNDGRQYMAEGYVYGPQFDKRAFIREVEAIVKSISLARKES